MYLPITNELQGRYQELIFVVFKVQLSLITLQSMKWKLGQLSSLLLLDSLELAHHLRLDGDVSLQVIRDDARRNLTDNTLQGDIRLKSGLEVLNHARFSDLDT